LTDIHLRTNNLFQTITKDISDILKNTNHWGNYFKDFKNVIEDRDEIKKDFEHYQRKVLSLEEHYSKEERLNESHAKRKLERVIYYNIRILINSDMLEKNI
jgi:predicted component of type VI protein secretion system